MKFPFPIPFRSPAVSAAAASRLWPICVDSPQTLSFRISTGDDGSKVSNSAYLDDDSKFTQGNCSTGSFSSNCNSEICNYSDEHPEGLESAVIGGLNSDRLFFEPGETNSILEEAKIVDACTDNDDGGVAVLVMESEDPYFDFRISMEEMVEAHGLKDWEHLEELLACYLRINREINHRYIVEAFLDFLIHLGMLSSIEDFFSSPSSIAAPISFTSPLSFSSSSNYSSTSAPEPENEEDRIIAGKIRESCSFSSSVSSSYVE